MKAIRYDTFGPPEALQLKEIAKPVPQPHQVLVKVCAASINAKEWRRYEMPSLLVRLLTGGWRKPKDPVIGTDVAGIVEAVGETVTRFKPGDEVFGCAHGSLAEYVLAREAFLTVKPANCSFEEAAAMPLAALTAIQAVRYAGGIHAGQQVLIQGASGGIGTFALQLVKASGAKVTAVCSARNVSLARSLGADHVIDYAKEDFTKRGKHYDLIFAINGYRSLWAYRRALKPTGLYVFVGGAVRQILEVLLFGKWLSQKGGRTMGNMGVTKINQDDLTQISELFKDGKLIPIIDCSYPLSQTADAMHYLVDQHAQGKVVIQVSKG
ncbi:MAG: NAD(P)-dependent alcohol dehydrogenase [Anaerolineales bacterium]|nr:MAG: NAD(P)-dependent alcohol dehydrogenase [Anaerolineales bacterium]